jgi:hypothetical protein
VLTFEYTGREHDHVLSPHKKGRELQHSVTIARNGDGQPASITDFARSTQFGYLDGDLVAITDPTNNTTHRMAMDLPLRRFRVSWRHSAARGEDRKVYGNDPESEKRYSPAKCIGCERKAIVGTPDPKYVSTSYVERQNLSVRMATRRYTRLTNAFSKKIENHAAAVALYYFTYNFIKIHSTLRCTPAMAAGVTDRLWGVSDLVALLEAEERGLERAA